MNTFGALMHSSSYAAGPKVKVDPLRERDALQEAQLLEIQTSTLDARTGILFDLRSALQLDEGNSALLVVRGTRSIEWKSTPSTSAQLYASSVIQSIPVMRKKYFSISLSMYPDASLVVTGEEVDYYQANAANIGDEPPDYSEASWEQINHELPSWNSRVTVLRVSSGE